MGLDAEAKEFLMGIPVFGGLPDMAMEQLMPLIVERGYGAGDLICTEGDPGREMFVVRDGQVEVRKRLGGDAGYTALARLAVGDCFGEMSLIDIQPRSASNLPAYAFLVQNLCRELSRRLRRADGVIAEFSLRSGRSDVPRH